MGVSVVSAGLLFALGALLLAAGIEDARQRTISNWTNAAVAALAPAWWWAQGYALWPDVPLQLVLAAIVMALFVGAFALGMMGGGDVKLIAALALWLPVVPFFTMFVWVALIGGALTAIMIVDEWVRRRATRPRPTAFGLVAGVVTAGLVATTRSTSGQVWMQAHPLLMPLVPSLMLCGLAALLTMGVRAARRRGVAPETPYGVAIAIAGLLALREPILNQFA